MRFVADDVSSGQFERDGKRTRAARILSLEYLTGARRDATLRPNPLLPVARPTWGGSFCLRAQHGVQFSAIRRRSGGIHEAFRVVGTETAHAEATLFLAAPQFCCGFTLAAILVLQLRHQTKRFSGDPTLGPRPRQMAIEVHKAAWPEAEVFRKSSE